MIVADKMQKSMDEEVAIVVGEGDAKVLRLARERLVGEDNVAKRRLPGTAGAAGNESTFVGLSIPRQLRLSARNVASSARQRLTSPPRQATFFARRQRRSSRARWGVRSGQLAPKGRRNADV